MIHVGICSWTEKTLIESGEFYPKAIKTPEARLHFYSNNFDTVEIDSTYYAIPDKNNAYLWTKRAPDHFIFHVKVFGALTGHPINPGTLPRDIHAELSEKDKREKQIFIKEPFLLRIIAERFMTSIYPLMGSGKLGLLVFQFPPWFRYSVENYNVILRAKEYAGRQAIGIEFRHGSWYRQAVRESVFHFLRKNGIVHIIADEPQYGSLATVPFIPQTTADIAYYRFHGRNAENWLRRGIPTSLRYAYEYSESELSEFVPHIQTSAKFTQQTYVMFNNCHGASAVRNAKKIKQLLSQELQG